MKVAVVIANYNRYELLKQELESLFKNTVSELQVIVVDDASEDQRIKPYLESLDNVEHVFLGKREFIGDVKNVGVGLIKPCDYIHFCDNDIYYLPDWDIKLIGVFKTYPKIGLIGGKRSPNHTLLQTFDLKSYQILIMNRQPGYSMFIRYEDLNKFTPFEAHRFDEQGGEDSRFNEKVEENGFKIAAIEPPVILHCGMTSYTGRIAADVGDMLSYKMQYPEILFI